MTLSADQDPDDPVRKLEVNIQLPDGPPPVQAQHPFQVRFLLAARIGCFTCPHGVRGKRTESGVVYAAPAF